MAYFKPFSRHGMTGGRDGRQEYLEQGRGPTSQEYLEEKTPNRAIARDFINIPESRQHDWGSFMDAFRHASGNDEPWKGRRAVTYQEYVLSPDPKDAISVEALRSLCTEWAQSWFGEEGKKGSYQVAIIYHDDNASQIRHAHVVVNNTNLQTGRRLHLSNRENVELRSSLQKLCEQRGLRHFSIEDERDINWRKQTERPIAREKVEKEVIARGDFSWKEDLRCYSEVAKRTTRSIQGYISELEEYGIGIEERDGDFFYVHPAKPGRWRCFGATLGKDYTMDGISSYYEQIEKGFLEIPKDFPQTMRERIRDYILETRPSFAVLAGPNTSLKAVAACLRTNDRYQITCQTDYDAKLKEFAIQMQRAADPATRKKCKRAYAQLSASKKTAAKGDFFNGIQARQIESPTFDRSSVDAAAAKGAPASTAGDQRVQAKAKTRAVDKPQQGHKTR